jgi:hypothetical protein
LSIDTAAQWTAFDVNLPMGIWETTEAAQCKRHRMTVGWLRQEGRKDMVLRVLVKNNLLTCCVVMGALLIISQPMLAHHGQVVYQRKSITLKGSVTKYEWSNPHTIITLAVPTEKGGVDEWYLEVLPPTQMLQAGWTKETLKPGDEITASGRPGRGGERIMWLEYLVTADGRKLSR